MMVPLTQALETIQIQIGKVVRVETPAETLVAVLSGVVIAETGAVTLHFRDVGARHYEGEALELALIVGHTSLTS